MSKAGLDDVRIRTAGDAGAHLDQDWTGGSEHHLRMESAVGDAERAARVGCVVADGLEFSVPEVEEVLGVVYPGPGIVDFVRSPPFGEEVVTSARHAVDHVLVPDEKFLAHRCAVRVAEE